MISLAQHPQYLKWSAAWADYRCCYNGGDEFVNSFLKKYSMRESDDDFGLRRLRTFAPNVARTSLLQIKDILAQGLEQVQRTGSEAYTDFCNNVTGDGISITSLLQEYAVPELLAVGGVYAYIDRVGTTDTAVVSLIPRESVINWANDASTGKLINICFCVDNPVLNERGLVVGTKRAFTIITDFGNGEIVLVEDVNTPDEKATVLEVKSIPVAHVTLPQCLLTDVLRMEVSLLNVESTDMAYIEFSNFPLYTEQVANNSVRTSSVARAWDVEMQAGNTTTDETKDQAIEVGLRNGRTYQEGMERPAFINPSSDPLRVSMEKQERLEKRIDALIRRNLANLDACHDADGGLAVLARKLFDFERQIRDIWCMYFGCPTSDINIAYPCDFSLLTKEELTKQIELNNKQIDLTPSLTLQKELLKQNAFMLLGRGADTDTLNRVYDEIDKAQVIILDPDMIIKLHGAGLVDTELACTLVGMPKGTAEKAKRDHMERITAIAMAQTKGNTGAIINEARMKEAGTGGGDTSAKDEKKLSQSADTNLLGQKAAVRGEGK